MSISTDHKKRRHDGGWEIHLCCWNRNRHAGPDTLDAGAAVLVPLRRADRFESLFRPSQENNVGKAFFLELLENHHTGKDVGQAFQPALQYLSFARGVMASSTRPGAGTTWLA